MKKYLLILPILFLSGILLAQNNALDFDGTNDYVNLGSDINSQIGNQITISAWIYPEANAYGDRGFITNYWYKKC